MRSLLNYLSGLIRPQKTIRFEQLGSFAFEEYNTISSLKQILSSSKEDVQFHLRLFNPTPNDESADRTALIQCVHGSKEKYLICQISAYWTSTWEAISLDDLIEFILREGEKSKEPLETFTLLTRAEEGKRVGEE
jgi:hypothetical protein